MTPEISVIILNYNGDRWLERCYRSLRDQTIFSRVEVITADNSSGDRSAHYAEETMNAWPNGRFIQHGANLGFCEGNNQAARHATGEFLFFLNNDTWLEPDCLEKLLEAVRCKGANCATPIMLNYSSDEVQSVGAEGFDLFGLMSFGGRHDRTREVFVAGGCSFLICRKDFLCLGAFDSEFFMYGEEYDLSWRNWLAGGRVISVPSARLHHRGPADCVGGDAADTALPVSSFTKRYFANRNNLIVVLKNAECVLLLLFANQLLLLAIEAVVSAVMVGQPKFVHRAYWEAIRDCWRLRGHILRERWRIRRFRERSDFWCLRFFRIRLNRWDEIKKIRQTGLPILQNQ